MTKLTKAQDAAIEKLAKETLKEKPIGVSLHKKVYENLKPFGFVECYVAIPGQNRHYCKLTDTGREYARSRGWLAAEAAPVAAAEMTVTVECPNCGKTSDFVPVSQSSSCPACGVRYDGVDGAALKVGDTVQVITDDFVIGVPNGVIGVIVESGDFLGYPVFAVRFDTLARTEEISPDWLKKVAPQPAAALPAPDSQFVDAATHVAIDSERAGYVEQQINTNEVKVNDVVLYSTWRRIAHIETLVNGWTRFIDDDGESFVSETFSKIYRRTSVVKTVAQTTDIAKLESELQAARVEIARLAGLLSDAKAVMFSVSNEVATILQNDVEYSHSSEPYLKLARFLTVLDDAKIPQLESATS